MHKSPLLRIPKINGFCLECHFFFKKCWFEVGQSEFKHPVLHYKNYNSNLKKLLGLRNLQKKLENTFYVIIQILPAHADKKRITQIGENGVYKYL